MPPAKQPQGGRPPASKEEARRRITRLTYWSLPFLPVFAVLNLIPNIPLPWRLGMLAAEVVFVIVYGTGVVRISLWQRDEYWRKRGRDPKHPERFPNDRPQE
ncbi:hypothetical protein [Pseudarthrobacter enclensis]|uniref:Transporter suffix domain-containing protein n=1 Tax=Pseudarthrobacter enclensis TaxID=993070 RepID=A0ABT9RW98_9MICC|nr:hypothetical protein [Pseudarthrobacter enclensis]MDP9889517.1 hypothetical protein [Pseudarthrobacter enclensis]